MFYALLPSNSVPTFICTVYGRNNDIFDKKEGKNTDIVAQNMTKQLSYTKITSEYFAISNILCNFAVSLQIYITIMEYIERQIVEIMQKAAKYFPVICITGPRQSGKSTLIRHKFQNYMRFSMEDYNTRELAESDPISFLNQTKEGMILDEIQRLPMLLSYIQGIVDEHPERKFVISGSSNFTLMRGISQSLAGRVGVFDLLPMSYKEMAELWSHKTIDEILFSGMYPAICAEKNTSGLYYPSYIRTYIDRDIRELVNVSNISQFHIFLKLCAARIGSIFNASELANETGVSVNTINSWLTILEASYIVMRLQPWSENTRKRLTKSPKIYFCDTGLACHLLNIESPEQLARDKMRGHLFENFIIIEQLKGRLNNGKASNAYFFRDSNRNEIDLLVDNGGELDVYEIKSSMTFSTSFNAVLQKTNALLTTKVRSKTVIYAGDLENRDGDIKLLNWRNL